MNPKTLQYPMEYIDIRVTLNNLYARWTGGCYGWAEEDGRFEDNEKRTGKTKGEKQCQRKCFRKFNKEDCKVLYYGGFFVISLYQKILICVKIWKYK